MNSAAPSSGFIAPPYSLQTESRFGNLIWILLMGLLVGCGADEEGVDWVDPGAFPGGEQGGADGMTGSPSETSSTSTESTSNGGGGGSSGVDQDSVELYTAQCASCHGVQGEGISGPSLQRWSRGVEALVDRIDRTMPPGQPEICRGVCAERLARYILDTLDTDEPSLCDEEGVDVLPERRLRLLTRREYAQTIRDLFHLDDASEEQVCQPQRFVFDPQGGRYDTVHVAGTFNDWSPTIAEGGWPMAWDAAAGLWVVERALEEGTYAYKFVLNEAEWRQDANNPDAAPDGVGGFNSVVEVTCGQEGGVVLREDLTANFPVESRPEGYTYDNNAAAGLVTATHMSEYLDAAARIAPQAVDGLLASLECSSGQACAQAVVEQFGPRAYRRPLDAEERGRLVGLVLEADRVRDGVEIALRVMLSSPHFLYRSEMGEPQGNGTWVLTAWEVATALSYTFWGTMPDEVLFAAAESGALDTPAGIALQARRLLGDVRSRAMWSTFAVQWLGVEKILTANKKSDLFPGFDRELREALVEETRRFVAYVVFEGSQNFDELLTADYTVANRRVAEFYGLSGALGDTFERTALAGTRSGVLGHASVLGSYAHSDQSSPILRGLFVRQRLLCQELGAPPANAGGVPEVDPNATTRERFRQHTDDPFCNSCHQFIDDLGFGFEHFDAVGRVRREENGQPIDHLGNMNDVEGFHTGTDAPFETLPELAGILAASQSARACFVTQYYRFALGQLEQEEERCNLHRLYNRFAEHGFDIQELMIATTQSSAFTHRR